MRDETSPFNLRAYLRDQAATVAIALGCAASVGIAVKVLGCPGQAAALLAATVVLFFAAALAVGYARKHAFYHDVGEAVTDESDAYYLPELIKRPRFIDGQLLYDAIDDVAKADAALLAAEREAAARSREYVELWTHEVKTPIAAARLTLSHMHGPDAQALKQEIERIELACERALYSSRTSNLSRDYVIREMSLETCCKNACKDLANLLTQGLVCPVFEFADDMPVLADEQWVRFVVKQVVSNSVKYQAKTIAFATQAAEVDTPHGHVDLLISDDGIGIPLEELPSIFERGFSGSNGRHEGKSTGMGLYLAAQVCKAMGVGLSASSTQGTGTTVALSFPIDRSRV